MRRFLLTALSRSRRRNHAETGRKVARSAANRGIRLVARGACVLAILALPNAASASCTSWSVGVPTQWSPGTVSSEMTITCWGDWVDVWMDLDRCIPQGCFMYYRVHVHMQLVGTYAYTPTAGCPGLVMRGHFTFYNWNTGYWGDLPGQLRYVC